MDTWSTLMDQVLNTDLHVQAEARVPLYVRADSLHILNGMQVDFAKGEMGQYQLIYTNPNEGQRCGCGESFNIKGMVKVKVKDIAVVKREVTVVLIPYGEKIDLFPGTEVLITQAKGDSFTLNVSGNLVRLDGKDADAIGKEPPRFQRLP